MDHTTPYHYGQTRKDGVTTHNFAPCPLNGRPRCQLPHWRFDDPDAEPCEVIDLNAYRRDKPRPRWGPRQGA